MFIEVRRGRSLDASSRWVLAIGRGRNYAIVGVSRRGGDGVATAIGQSPCIAVKCLRWTTTGRRAEIRAESGTLTRT